MVKITRNRSIERKIVLRIYAYLMALIIIDPLLNKFVLNTTILRSLELMCLIVVAISEVQLFLHKKQLSYKGYIKFLLLALLVITVGIILRGEWSNISTKDFALKAIGDAKCWIIPFLILPLPNYKYSKEILLVFLQHLCSLYQYGL